MHLTENCLLKVPYDITMASDAGDCSVWVLLELSSAFDTVDLTLDWVSSYVTNRSCSIFAKTMSVYV